MPRANFTHPHTREALLRGPAQRYYLEMKRNLEANVTHWKRLEASGPVLLGAATFLLFCVSLHGVFILDDYPQIVGNLGVHSLRNLHDVIFCGTRQLRLLSNLTFALDWLISDGESWSFHVTNICLHLLNGWLLLTYLRILLPRARFAPLFATALFLIHPLQLQGVTYIMARSSLLECLFFLAALNLYAKKHSTYYWPLHVLLMLAMLAKETCALIPPVLVLHGLYFQDRPYKWIWSRLNLVYLSAPLCFGLIYLILGEHRSMYAGVAGFDFFPFFEYGLVQGYYHLFHLYLFLNPLQQSLSHEYPGLTTLTLVLGVVGWFTYLALLIQALRARRLQPVASFFILFYMLTLLPTNTLLQLVNPFAEYRLYQANLSLCVLLALGLSWVAVRVPNKVVRTAVPTLIVLYFLVFNILGQQLWLDPIALVSRSLVIYPDSAFLNEYLAWEYERMGDLTAAAAAYARADENRPNTASPPTQRSQFKRAQIYVQLGRIKEARELLDKMPIDQLELGRPPLQFFQLYLDILIRLRLHKDFNEMRMQAVQYYGNTELPRWP